MRIVFLNSWFGNTGRAYFDFVKEKSSDTEIFCFMEVTNDLFRKLSVVLTNFQVIYESGRLLEALKVHSGQSIFVRKDTKIVKSGRMSIFHQSKNDVGLMQYACLNVGKAGIWLGNVHGKARPGEKLDTPARIKQSEKIINFFKDKIGPKIIGGDFNLELNTKSVKMFEEAGYRNLIKDYDIKNTRNRLSWEQFNNVQHFADYVFVSQDVKVKNFEVPNIEISDHLPLILDFEI